MGEPRRRPGGRSARVRAAALEATLAELAESGYPELTLARVASRAGVNKTTLYRRWGTREALVLDAMLELAGEGVKIPDTGSLHGDLLAIARGSAATTARTTAWPCGLPAVRADVVASASRSPASEPVSAISMRSPASESIASSTSASRVPQRR